jgi:hypothetical protein
MRRRAARIAESSKNIMYMVNRYYNCLMGPQSTPPRKKTKPKQNKNSSLQTSELVKQKSGD